MNNITLRTTPNGLLIVPNSLLKIPCTHSLIPFDLQPLWLLFFQLQTKILFSITILPILELLLNPLNLLRIQIFLWHITLNLLYLILNCSFKIHKIISIFFNQPDRSFKQLHFVTFTQPFVRNVIQLKIFLLGKHYNFIPLQKFSQFETKEKDSFGKDNFWFVRLFPKGIPFLPAFCCTRSLSIIGVQLGH